MAELINEIVGKEAFEQVARLDKELGLLVDKFERNQRAALLLEKALANSSGVTETTKNIKAVAKANEDLAVTVEEVRVVTVQAQVAQNNYTDAINETQKAELKAQQSSSAWASKQKAQSADRVKQTSAEAVTINSLTAENKALRIERDKLDISTEIGRQKIAELNEGIKQNNLLILKNQDVIKKQAANVGNYASATVNLEKETKKINGTMAGFTGIVGKAWGAIRQLAYIIPGLGIAGIMGFAIEGVMALANSLNLLSTKTKEEIEQAKVFTEIHKEMIKIISTETTALQVNYQTATNTNLSYKQRAEAVDYLQKQYPDMFENANREKLLNGELSGSYALLSNQIMKRAQETADLNILNRKVLEHTETQLQLDKLMGKGLDKDDFYYTTQSKNTLEGKLALQSRELKIIEEKIQKNKEGFGNDVFYINETVKKQVEAQQKIDKYYAEHGKTTNTKQSTTKKEKESKGKPFIDPKLSDTDLEDLKKYYAAIKDQFVKTMGEWVDDPESNKAFEEYLGSVVKTDNPISDAEAEDLSKAIFKKINDNAEAIQLKIDKQKALEEAKELLAEINQMVGMATSAMADITGIQYDREIAAIDKRNKALSDSYDAEKKMIDGKYTNQAEKTKALAELDAKHEAQQKQIDRDRISADRKRAQQEKAYNIANIITSTALAVIKAYTEGDPYTKIPRAILAGAAGAASLARAIAAPLPQYADGTDNHKGGLAIVGERGTELGVLPSGKTFLTDSVPTIMDLPKGTQIIPHEKLMAQVYNLAFKKLGDGNKVTSDSMQIAMMESFENKLEELIQETKRNKSNTNVNINGNFDHYMHVQKNIR